MMTSPVAMAPLDRHQNIVFQFSGGKDSIACLLLLKAYLHRITVLWMNTGAAFPETLEQMTKVRAMCPNFIEVNGNQPAQIEAMGWPVDLLPMRNDRNIQFMTQQHRLPLQGFLSCCLVNLMQPMHEATLATGATLIIRGQKAADHHKSPVRSGDSMAGVEFWFPLEDWSDTRVFELVRGSDLLPAHYSDANTSLDCWSCTAYLGENQWKLPYLQKHHPEKAIEVKRRLIMIRNEIAREFKNIGVCDAE